MFDYKLVFIHHRLYHQADLNNCIQQMNSVLRLELQLTTSKMIPGPQYP